MENKLPLKTPLIYSDVLSKQYSANIYLKCENLQRTNSFKIRGASHFVYKYLSKNKSVKGFCTHSSGNHGKALAFVCKELNIDCKIVVPNNAPKFKVNSMQTLGAEITFCESDTKSRLAEITKIEAEGFVQVPPYNHEWIMEGQSNVAKEIFEDLKNIDGIICPVGGGGLSGGTVQFLEKNNKNCALVLAEPNWANDTFNSLKNNSLQENTRFDSIADGLRANLGKKNFEVLKNYNNISCICCSEEDIEKQTLHVLQHEKILIETSSATVFAAMQQIATSIKNKTWVLIISGGNLDVGTLIK